MKKYLLASIGCAFCVGMTNMVFAESNSSVGAALVPTSVVTIMGTEEQMLFLKEVDGVVYTKDSAGRPATPVTIQLDDLSLGNSCILATFNDRGWEVYTRKANIDNNTVPTETYLSDRYASYSPDFPDYGLELECRKKGDTAKVTVTERFVVNGYKYISATTTLEASGRNAS
jgi:hypothetical protein